ncbi:MAG TPA: DUF2808 domain-containing protein, partial [Candidatus Caenarcaniphilales bacterium]
MRRQYQQFCSRLIGGSLLVCLSAWGVLTQSTQAVQLADGTVYFNHPPRLLSARTTHNSIRTWGATYYFTLSVPADAGEPLQRIAIAQREAADEVQFKLDNTRAFTGGRRGEKLILGEVTVDQSRQAVSV